MSNFTYNKITEQMATLLKFDQMLKLLEALTPFNCNRMTIEKTNAPK